MPQTARDLILNGRFLSRPMTGVDRVAAELSTALLAQLATQDGPSRRLRLALPKAGAQERDNSAQAIAGLLGLDVVPTMASDGYFWEQVALWRTAPEDWLLSFCNMGPVWRTRQVVMIHDAQVFSQPQAYSRKFRAIYNLLQPPVAKRASVVLTVSDFSRRQLEDHGVVPPGKAIVVHNGVDHIHRISPDASTLARHRLNPQGYFLAIGTLAPHKNLPMLIEVARNRPEGALPLVVAGGGNASVFSDHGLIEGKGVRFLGRVTDGELVALYQGATALAFPSLTEGFGLPPLEAMAHGCPAIVTTGGAVPEVCGDAALFADPEDPAAWRAALEVIEANPERRKALAAAGKAQAARFTWERAAQKVLAAITAAETSAAAP